MLYRYTVLFGVYFLYGVFLLGSIASIGRFLYVLIVSFISETAVLPDDAFFLPISFVLFILASLVANLIEDI